MQSKGIIAELHSPLSSPYIYPLCDSMESKILQNSIHSKLFPSKNIRDLFCCFLSKKGIPPPALHRIEVTLKTVASPSGTRGFWEIYFGAVEMRAQLQEAQVLLCIKRE